MLRQIVSVDECARLHSRHLDLARQRIALRENPPAPAEESWLGDGLKA